MAEIHPFRAIRYREHNVSALIAPPYDVLDTADKQALLARSNRNVVAIDLPQCPAKTAGPQKVYDAAAKSYEDWIADGTLQRDPRAGLYVYHQSYTHGLRSYTRRKFFARLRLEEFGAGQVFPHEQTFGGPKEDRLLLTRATKANLSPIFGLFPDAKNEIAAAFDAAIRSEPPTAEATMDGVEHRLWAVGDPMVTDKVVRMMRDKPVFIADGHHRYGTALLYRAERARSGAGLSNDDPANFVLCVFAGMEDPGLLILPTHRVLCDLPTIAASGLGDALEQHFEVTHAPDVREGPALAEMLPRFGPLAMGAFVAGEGRSFVFAPRDPDLLARYEPNRKPAWRKYGLSILHRYVIDEVVRPKFAGGREITIHYIKDAAGAAADARTHHGVSFIVQPTTMTELRDMCTAGELMPQKSTFFFPKLATGMVINPLA